MQIDKCTDFIINTLNKNGYQAYLIGESIRNIIMKIPVDDIVIKTDATTDCVYNLFGTLDITVINSTVKHNEISIIMSESDINKNVQPKSTEESKVYKIRTFSGKTINEELLNCDFTINSLAYNTNCGIIDILNGKKDISNKIIKHIDCKNKQHSNECITAVKALQLQSKLGFVIDNETKDWIGRTLSNTEFTYNDKLKSIVIDIMTGDYVIETLQDNQDIVGIAVPEIKECIGFNQNNPYHKYDVYGHIINALKILVCSGEKDYRIRLATLLHDIGKPSTATLGEDGYTHFMNHCKVGAEMAENILKRLHFEADDIKYITDIIKCHDLDIGSKSGVKRIINKIGFDAFNDLLILRYSDILSQSNLNISIKLEKLKQLKIWFEELKKNEELIKMSDLKFKGKDLIELGFKPGDIFSTILTDLLQNVNNDSIENDNIKLKEYVTKKYGVSV